MVPKEVDIHAEPALAEAEENEVEEPNEEQKRERFFVPIETWDIQVGQSSRER